VDAVADFKESSLREEDAEVAVGEIGDGRKIRGMVLVKMAVGISHLGLFEELLVVLAFEIGKEPYPCFLRKSRA